MEFFAGLGVLAWLVLVVLCGAIIIAPLIIWRNTNRSNDLLAELIDEARKTNENLERLARSCGRREQPAPQQAAEQPQDFELT